MADIAQLEDSFQKYIQNPCLWIPDGIITIDLTLLQRLCLLNFSEEDGEQGSSRLTQYFHVVEAPEKITLFNEKFAVWIVPEVTHNTPVTYCLVAFNRSQGTELELVFSASGIYNTSRMVLRVLEKLLAEIEETEEELSKMS